MLNVDFEFVLLSKGTGHAARMLAPCPIMSGFKIPGISMLWPLEENEAIVGADDSPIIVPLNKIVVIGDVVQLM